MTVYTYSLTYIDNRNNLVKVGMGTEERLFDTAVALDKQGMELTEAVREVWEQTDGVARLIKVQPYRMGKPVDA